MSATLTSDPCAPHGDTPREGGLALGLRSGERMLINGGEIVFAGRCTIWLPRRVSFVFGKQVMSPAEATTLLRRIYLAMQTAYAGDDYGDAAAVQPIITAILTADSISPLDARQIIDGMRTGQWHAALKIVRNLIRVDEAEAAA